MQFFDYLGNPAHFNMLIERVFEITEHCPQHCAVYHLGPISFERFVEEVVLLIITISLL